MKRFMVLFTSSVPAEQQMNVSPEEMQKGMQPWLDWFSRAGAAVIDRGQPLGNGVSIKKEGSAKASFPVAGYSILQADSMEEAKELLSDHPHLSLAPGAGIEVFELLAMPGI